VSIYSRVRDLREMAHSADDAAAAALHPSQKQEATSGSSKVDRRLHPLHGVRSIAEAVKDQAMQGVS
jgi:hypothetical protein